LGCFARQALRTAIASSPLAAGIEARASSHHWSRELPASGHTVRLMPPSYVKAYLKRTKNDANDAAVLVGHQIGKSAWARQVI